MYSFTIAENINKQAPDYVAFMIAFDLVNTPSDPALWQEIDAFIATYAADHVVADINKEPAILATRQVYKRLGKDPNRYRPSAEALRRRVLKEKSLYQIDTLVDLINLVSLKTGYSIGGFDADKIVGTHLELGVGQAGEPFSGIGRGALNIEGLPVYRDAVGGIGTPTSDEERTKISLATRRSLIIVNGYDGGAGLEEVSSWFVQLLTRYVGATSIETKYYPTI